MINTNSYKPKQFNLSGLNGISDQTLEMHFKLYEGYVKETNKLTDKIAEFLRDGKVDQEEVPAYSELTRRLGFEYNGMVLHEYYFGNMKQGGAGDQDRASGFFRAAEESFGSYDIGRRILRASARCAELVGPSVTRIRLTDGSPIIGLHFMRRETWPASIQCL
ncbi:MAG: hypothetical protein ACT4OT_17710 [Acidobacteriota bacterium]